MNGPQDLGGLMGFGPVAPEPNEPVFHAAWERRAFGTVVAAGCLGQWTIDESRFARENRHPSDYYGSSYYEIWIKALETLLLERGLVTAGDLLDGLSVDPVPAGRPAPDSAAVLAMVGRGSPYDRPLATAPRFGVGDRVRTRTINPTGHTRLPRYARGKIGEVIGVHGGFVFADDNARQAASAPQHLYTLRICATELWGPDGDPLSDVRIDAWESYLDPA